MPSALRPATPAERRAKRLRRVFYTLFFTFLLLALFGVAWFGVSIQHRNPPAHAIAHEPPDGTLVLRTDALARSLEVHGQGDSSRISQLLRQQAGRLLPFVGPHVQVFYWEPESSEPGQEKNHWIAYLPLQRPHRLHQQRLRNLLLEARLQEVEAQEDPASSAAPIAFFRLDRRGLTLAPTSAIPDLALELGPAGETDALATYTAPSGYTPAGWEPLLGVSGDHPLTRLVWQGQSFGTAELDARFLDGSERSLKSFHPLLLRKEDPSP